MTLADKIIEILTPLLKNEKEIAFLMYPNHWNVGDSVIWYGTIVALRKLGIKVRYIANHHTYSSIDLVSHVPDGAILLCGGGNFGDLYPDEGGLRMSVLKDFQDRKIIQLPQSIWFDNVKSADAMKPFIKSKNFHLLVRDKDSLTRATDLLGINATLCPDMAFMLDGILRKKSLGDGEAAYRYLKRDDKESHSNIGFMDDSESSIVTDWLQEDDEYRGRWPMRGVAAYKIVQMWVGRVKLPMWLIIKSANTLARVRTNVGLNELHRGEHLVTDRLHAGIMGAITGQQVSMIDNVYGKNGSLYSAWLKGRYDNVDLYNSFEEFYSLKK